MKGKSLLLSLISIALVAGLVASVFVSGCAPPAGVKEEPKVFKVGSVWAYSGAFAGWGWCAYPSQTIWRDEVNAAGGITVGGEKYMVEIVQYDHEGDPAAALGAVRKAIYQDGIKYFDHCCGQEVHATCELINAEKAIVISLATGIGDILGREETPYIFGTFPQPWECISVSMICARQEYPEYTRVAGIAPDVEAGHVYIEGLREVMSENPDYELVDIVVVPPDQDDFYSVLTPLIGKVDIIQNLCLNFSAGGQLVKQARELGFEGAFIFPDSFDFETTKEIAGVEACEDIIGIPEGVGMPTDAGKRWAEQYQARYGTLLWGLNTVYDGLRLLQKAIEKADTFDTEKVAAALGEVELEEGCSGYGVGFHTCRFSPDLPRYLKAGVPAIVIRDGQKVDIYAGFSTLWD